jgi:excisionase family DNA binding protein
MARKPPETPLYVKLPSAAVERLEQAAITLGVTKKELVTGLVEKYIHPGGLKPPAGATMGTYSFQAYDPPEAPPVMNAHQAGQFLQIDENHVIELAEAGKLPGKKLGPVWRFSREALVAWLAAPDKEPRR